MSTRSIHVLLYRVPLQRWWSKFLPIRALLVGCFDTSATNWPNIKPIWKVLGPNSWIILVHLNTVASSLALVYTVVRKQRHVCEIRTRTAPATTLYTRSQLCICMRALHTTAYKKWPLRPVNLQCFSFTVNQRTVLSIVAFHRANRSNMLTSKVELK
jgi:hypothetical protein